MDINLSKSRYCRGLQCPKMLWLEQHKPEMAVNTAPESILANGNMVGDYARRYFGEYSLVEYNTDKTVMAEQTAELMAKGAQNIAEASFCTDGLYCAVDILHRNGSSFDIVEVKSSTSSADIYIEDMSFQYYVLTQCGIPINKVYLLHINSNYTRQGELEIDRLFTLEDHTDDAKERFDKVGSCIRSIRQFNDTDTEPDYAVGVHCTSPYDCAFDGYCKGVLPEHNVFDIYRLGTKKKYELYHKGIISFADIISNGVKLGAAQKLQVETTYYNKPDSIDPEGIKSFLDTLTYPVYHLDFETFMQPIPEFDGVRPYMQIPFQYSLHIEQKDGSLDHKEYLAKEGTDPRRGVAESLCKEIPDDVCVLAYNMSFEQGVLANLAEQFPDLSEHLLAIRKNMKDLATPFQKKWYYTEAMGGYYTIKKVLPALFPDDPELDYHNLEGVHHGGEASAAFATLADHTPEEIAVIRSNLLKYCGLDTYAMVKLLSRLREACGEDK